VGADAFDVVEDGAEVSAHGGAGVVDVPTRTVHALRGQDCLYSLTERRPAGSATRVVGALTGALAMHPSTAVDSRRRGEPPTMNADFLAQLSKDRVIAVVRAPRIPDAAALCQALREGGIHWIEFTRTTPGLAAHLRRAVADGQDGAGAGTVMTSEQAEELIDAGGPSTSSRPAAALTWHKRPRRPECRSSWAPSLPPRSGWPSTSVRTL
jgi:hypothetical protein